MYIFNRDQIKPSIDVLLKCHKISINIDKIKPKAMRDWALDHCESFVWWESYENNHTEDVVVEYYFTNGEDATLFKLKWA